MTAVPDTPGLYTSQRFERPRGRYLIDCAGVRFQVHARSLATVLRIGGEIDASNVNPVAQAIRRFSQLKAPLILDFSHLDFLGVAGFRALLTLNHEYQQAELHCIVVTGAVMRPLTHVFPDHGLLIVDSVPEALRLMEKVI